MASELGLVSLFCGAGGLDKGFEEAGFTTRLAYDNDPASVETHRHNHPLARALQRDLSKIAVAAIIEHWEERSPGRAPVGVIGGPPCQSFSIGNAYQSESDPRHELPAHYARILEGLNRAYGLDFFVFENVPALITGKHRDKYARFKQLFEDAGFRVTEEVLDAQRFGVAQVRPRGFVVGLNRARYAHLVFEYPAGNGSKRVWVRHRIGDLPEPVLFRRGLSPDDMPFHPNHWCMRPRSRKFVDGSLRRGEIRGRSFRVLQWEEPSYTVAYGHREVHVHPNCHRRLSVLEAMLLQGFQRSDVLKGTLSDQIRLVSEAVSPPVAKALAEALRDQLGLSECRSA